MRKLASIIVTVLSPLVAFAAAPAPEALTIHEWEALWTAVLARNVDDAGRVDFGALARDRADLDRVVAFVATVDPGSQPQRFPDRAARLAFYINAYNALAMHGIVEAGTPASLGGLNKVAFFYFRKFSVGGGSISLYNFENDVIRPLSEERVHFALNCMVVGCPRLPRTAFSADALERQLDAATRAFLAEKRNVSVDAARREVWLSAIFDFYTADFLAHAPTLIDYVNRYLAEPIPYDFKVRFFDYDWTVNDRRRAASNASGSHDSQRQRKLALVPFYERTVLGPPVVRLAAERQRDQRTDSVVAGFQVSRHADDDPRLVDVQAQRSMNPVPARKDHRVIGVVLP